MDSYENQEIQLSEQNLKSICRLCLREDEEFAINIFDRADSCSKKLPLAKRIQELYQINVSNFRKFKSIDC